VVAVGHSGAYRTLREWLDDPFLEEVVLIDALYEDLLAPLDQWLRASPRHRVVDVTQDTVRWSEELARGHDAVVLDRVPVDELDWTDEARTARAVLVRSQRGHMQLVTGGETLPVMVRLATLR